MPAVAAAALSLSSLPAISLAIVPLLIIHLWHSHRHQPVGLWLDDGGMTVKLLNGRRIVVRPVRVYCLSWLQVLRLRCWRGHYHTMVVMPDSGDRDQRHQWRYFLRHDLTAKPVQGLP